MFNNEVTYHEKWNTPENKAALEELNRLYFDKSGCSPDCPLAWAPEVLELMNLIESELGIEYNTSTMRGYRIQGNPKDWFLINPFVNLIESFRNDIMKAPTDWSQPRGADGERPKLSVVARFKRFLCSPFTAFSYGFRAIKIKHINAILNRIYKPKVELAQIKEKYGSLRLYYGSPLVYKEWIDREVRKTEIKLAMKGAYYPIESFWDSGSSYTTGTEFHPDVISSTLDKKGNHVVTETLYREIMKDLGLDLEEIKRKAEESSDEGQP